MVSSTVEASASIAPPREIDLRVISVVRVVSEETEEDQEIPETLLLC